MVGLNFVLRWRSGSRTVATKRNESRSNNTKRPFSVQPNEFQCKCWFERMVRCGQEVDRIISQDWIQHSYPFIGIRCVGGILKCLTLLLIIGLCFFFSSLPSSKWLMAWTFPRYPCRTSIKQSSCWMEVSTINCIHLHSIIPEFRHRHTVKQRGMRTWTTIAVTVNQVLSEKNPRNYSREETWIRGCAGHMTRMWKWIDVFEKCWSERMIGH